MQELIVATCTESPYSISKNLLSKYLGLEINEMQLCRVTSYYGEVLEPVLTATKSLHSLANDTECLYAQVDGSMILTREEHWKEVKMGRVFTAKSCLQIEGKVDNINASQYVSHFGDCNSFTKKMDHVLDDYGKLKDRLIFITDGAIWIKNWIEDAYPNAVSILDFYHAKEYLCAFAKEYFSIETERYSWINQQEALLLESHTQQVIDKIDALQKIKKTACGIKTIAYYSSNIDRMDYKYYKTIGKGIIGSGAIESAHRTVVQCRMKLSGQRWSKNGAKKILVLRNLKMNNQWDEIVKTIKIAA